MFEDGETTPIDSFRLDIARPISPLLSPAPQSDPLVAPSQTNEINSLSDPKSSSDVLSTSNKHPSSRIDEFQPSVILSKMNEDLSHDPQSVYEVSASTICEFQVMVSKQRLNYHHHQVTIDHQQSRNLFHLFHHNKQMKVIQKMI
jgi:hypothetical protein